MKVKGNTSVSILSVRKAEDSAYPKLLNLKLCRKSDLVRSSERDILETLLAFNSFNEVQSKHRHDLSDDPFIMELKKTARHNDCEEKNIFFGCRWQK